MVQVVRWILLGGCLLFGAARAMAQPIGDPPLPIDSMLDWQGGSPPAIVSLDYASLRRMLPGQLAIDTAMQIGLVRRGVPYKWGGDNWVDGLDCSHFTRKIFDIGGTGYSRYMTTAQLRDHVSGDGLSMVEPHAMRPGDLLVYGYEDDEGWHGHVVVLIDASYNHPSGLRGLVLGSHGSIGVQFVSYPGFPEYYREPHITLRRVLRP
jgi:hypothetical protein